MRAALPPPDFRTYPARLATLAPWGPFRATVGEWHDGDTGWFHIALGFGVFAYESIRLAGCNAPELVTPEGKAARDYIVALLPQGSPVVLYTEVTPQSGEMAQSFVRYVATVMLADGRDLASVMIDAGHAVIEHA